MGTDLVVYDPEKYAVLAPGAEDFGTAMRENFGTGSMSKFDLDRVRVPSAGGLTWQIPGLVTQESKEIEGVIVAWAKPRQYWSKRLEDSDGSQPPDCSSVDGLTGKGTPGGECAICSMDKWGSGNKAGHEDEEGGPKACKQTMELYIVRETDRLPLAIVAPPSSLNNIKVYMRHLASATRPFYSVVTRLTLEQRKDPVKHSVIVPTFIGVIPADKVAAFKGIGKVISDAIGLK